MNHINSSRDQALEEKRKLQERLQAMTEKYKDSEAQNVILTEEKTISTQKIVSLSI